MEYITRINQTLRPDHTPTITLLDLFAGCGGLALGFESIGFKTIGFEKDIDAATTYSQNLLGHCHPAELNLHSQYPPAQIIIGGPPCQPFSVGGHQLGVADERNGFPIFLEAVKQVNPSLFLFENVRGLLYANKWYFIQILHELRQLGYIVEYKLLNAVHYGVPQNRERLFVVGHRGTFGFPQPELKKVTVAEAIGDTMELAPLDSKFLTSSMDEYVKNYEIASKCVNPRDLYPNKPARTLTCRNIAAPTGDMHRVKLKDGRRRRLFVREAARLQSFPDWFEFAGNETSQFYQIGNAVPPLLAQHLAKSVKKYFEQENFIAPQELLENSPPLYQQMQLF